MSISRTRSALYRSSRLLGDLQAVRQGRLARRAGRRIAGRLIGRLFRLIFG